MVFSNNNENNNNNNNNNKRKTNEISHEKTWTWQKKRNLKKEIEFFK